MKEIVDHYTRKNNEDKLLKYIKWFITSAATLLVVSLMTKCYMDTTYYQIKFSKGDYYYVDKDEWTVHPDGKIEFKSFFWNRKVEGYNYRIIEPIAN